MTDRLLYAPSSDEQLRSIYTLLASSISQDLRRALREREISLSIRRQN